MIIKYQVINCTSLRIRKSPSIYSPTIGYLQKGNIISCVKGYSKKANGITWFKCSKGYVSSKYLKRITPNYLKRVSSYSDLVYNEIVNIGCKHEGGATSWDNIKNKKKTTCASAVSAVLQLSGILKENTLINHTPKGGTKDSVTKAISGVENLVPNTYDIVPVNATFKQISISKYKQKGVVYIYDSNIAINAGDGYIYSCNNGSSQIKNGKYVKDKMKSGYCFTSKILYLIIPRD